MFIGKREFDKYLINKFKCFIRIRINKNNNNSINNKFSLPKKKTPKLNNYKYVYK